MLHTLAATLGALARTPASAQHCHHAAAVNAAPALGARRAPHVRALSASSNTKTSLIPHTLAEMESDADFARTAQQLRDLGQKRLTLDEKKKRRRALDTLGVAGFDEHLQVLNLQKPTRGAVTLVQVNIGLLCNQACTHCHVESSPKRSETMSAETLTHVLRLLETSPSVETLDITGGAPEMHLAFRPLVLGARALGKEVIDRCNLTVLEEPGFEWLPEFLAENGVRIVASLPCYSQKNVDTQRGSKVFERSIAGLRRLNEVGYGDPAGPLKLDLVYNPGGAFLPPPQDQLHADYTRELDDAFGIRFNELFTITNVPIKRFADLLYKQGRLVEYMQLLVDNFNPGTLDKLMCRSMTSVSHDGTLFDCDFNYALDTPLASPLAASRNIAELGSLGELEGGPIATANHCFGCTAGQGSS